MASGCCNVAVTAAASCYLLYVCIYMNCSVCCCCCCCWLLLIFRSTSCGAAACHIYDVSGSAIAVSAAAGAGATVATRSFVHTAYYGHVSRVFDMEVCFYSATKNLDFHVFTYSSQFSTKLSINNQSLGLVHKDHIINEV